MKKGYFFIVDSMVALGVLAVGIVLIFSAHESSPPTGQSYTISEEVMNILQYNQIKDINNYYAGPNSILTRNNNITDIQKTLLEQVGEFYYRNQSRNCEFCIGLINSFMINITQNLVPAEYNYLVLIDNLTVFNHSITPISESPFVIPSKAIVHGVFNFSDLFGPYLVEVVSWS